MKTALKYGTTTAALALAISAMALVAAATPALEALRGGGIMAIAGCILCAGGGVASLFVSGGLAWAIWTVEGSAVTTLCAATCVAAVL